MRNHCLTASDLLNIASYRGTAGRIRTQSKIINLLKIAEILRRANPMHSKSKQFLADDELDRCSWKARPCLLFAAWLQVPATTSVTESNPPDAQTGDCIS